MTALRIHLLFLGKAGDGIRYHSRKMVKRSTVRGLGFTARVSGLGLRVETSRAVPPNNTHTRHPEFLFLCIAPNKVLWDFTFHFEGLVC